MQRRIISLIVIVIGAWWALGASCNIEQRIFKKQSDLTEELCKSADEFNRMIAWGYYDDASVMVLPEKKADFLMHAEVVYRNIKMEGYKVALCQVSPVPLLKIKGQITMPEPTPEPTPAPPPQMEENEMIKKPEPKNKNLKMPKQWYGMVLVRFINLTVAPTNKVNSPLIRQYWECRDDQWMVDPDLGDLMTLGQPPEAKPPAKTPEPQPRVPLP